MPEYRLPTNLAIEPLFILLHMDIAVCSFWWHNSFTIYLDVCWIILAYLTISTGIAAAVLGTSTPASVFIGHILYNILRGLPFYFVMTMAFKAYSAQAFPEQSWLRLLPNIQLSMLYDGSLIFTDYLSAVALSVIFSITIFTACIAIIRKTEL